MSAITSHLESTDPQDESAVRCELGGELRGFGASSKVCIADPYAAHAGLLQTLWTRRAVEDALSGRSYHVATGAELGKRREDAARLFLVLDPPLPKDHVPWSHLTRDDMSSVNLLGRPSKMACPAFDLPAGWMLAGGTCPAAGVCQTIVPEPERLKLEGQIADHVFLGPTGPSGAATGPGQTHVLEAICEQCYATGGRYQYAEMAIRMVLRHAWTRTLLSSGDRGLNEWVSVLVDAISRETFEPEPVPDPRGGQLACFRVHSSGDFFSRKYAQAWIAVANQFPQITFWAPTRTWAAPGWLEAWPKLLAANAPGNFLVRPSGLHFGDFAPTRGAHPWEGDYPFNAAGSTALYAATDDPRVEDNFGMNIDGHFDPRYDWGCMAYAQNRANEAKTCRDAFNPDGGVGCRVCWTHPRLRVRYAAH
jgi:hypothetical protein